MPRQCIVGVMWSELPMNLPVNRLIVFTRYPEAGTTKTRLIPALGAEGAATLQRQMTEYTLSQVNALQRDRPMEIDIRFAGGDRARMQSWLGGGYTYQPQGTGDLGTRMAQALSDGFAAGSDRLLVIGTDCPGLDALTLNQAFEQLNTADLVVGPATDGGYYLIGLRRPVPELFVGIDWSTERVLSQTLAIAQSLHLSVALLTSLGDVDRPDDLPLWEAVQQRHSAVNSMNSMDSISVIIPVLNEGDRLQECLQAALAPRDAEIIVVDGGSVDGTAELAAAMGAIVLQSPPGRARQMNRGAAAATGKILLFLHGDTRLPPDYPSQMRHTLAQCNIVAGAFTLHIASANPSLRWVEWGVGVRSRWLQLPYGDQALFLKADRFQAMGGFAELPIMEDFELVQRLQRQGRIAIAPATVLTSPRRWETLGVIRTTLINQMIIAGYFLGVPAERLARWYRRKP